MGMLVDISNRKINNQISKQQEERVIEFQGLNRRPMVEDGEMRDMKNLGGDDYPNLSQRKSRLAISHPYSHPVQMLVKYEKLAVLDEDSGTYYFWYDGVKCTSLSWSVQPRMIAIGTKICFFAPGIHQYYQVKDIEGTKAGSTGDLGVKTTFKNEVGVWLSDGSIEVSEGRQYIYEQLTSLDETNAEGFGAIKSGMTYVDGSSTITVTLGQRTAGTSQVRISVKASTITNAKLITYEIVTEPFISGTKQYRYAGYTIPDSLGAVYVTDFIDLKDYEYTNGVSIRVTVFAADNKYHQITVDMEDYGWTSDDFAAINSEKKWIDSYFVGDVVDMKGKVSSMATADEDMTEDEYNTIVDELSWMTNALSPGTGVVDMSLTSTEWNTLATTLDMDTLPTTQTVDMALSSSEMNTLATLEGLTVQNAALKYNEISDIDVAGEIIHKEGGTLTFNDNTFNVFQKQVESLVTEDNTLQLASTNDIPNPTAQFVLRSKAQMARCAVMWTVDTTGLTSTVVDGTSYLFQVREAGTDDKWETVFKMSHDLGNMVQIPDNAVTFGVTEVQVPLENIVYEFRMLAVNTNVRTTARCSAPTGGHPKCRALPTVYVVIGELDIERFCPDLDFVMEYNNRLWGCNNTNNEILACKLGDPTNWHYYQATSMDSFAASQGTDGEWTGCAAYSNHLLFFKEEYIHKVYGTSPSAFQISTQRAHGVESGSSKSVAIVNDIVLYHSRIGWMAYEGEAPEGISAKLGDTVYTDVVAGTDRKKYYCTASDGEKYHMFVFDTETGFWYEEDNTQAVDFCYYDGLVMFAKPDGSLVRIGAGDEQDIEWYAVLGAFDEYIEDKKVFSKLKMRLKLEEGSVLDVYIRMDDGEWELVNEYAETDARAQILPIVPRRCNRYEVKLEGKGRCRIESLLRRYRAARGTL